MAEHQSRAALDVLRERFRQQAEEGFSPERDDRYLSGELARAASAYAYLGALPQTLRDVFAAPGGFVKSAILQDLWPGEWSRKWWKPKERRRDLVRAAALLIAEIERLDRAEGNSDGEVTEKEVEAAHKAIIEGTRWWLEKDTIRIALSAAARVRAEAEPSKAVEALKRITKLKEVGRGGGAFDYEPALSAESMYEIAFAALAAIEKDKSPSPTAGGG